MKILSDNPVLLDEMFKELQREHMNVEKFSDEVKGAMSGDITTYIALGVLGLKAIDTLLNLLSFRQKQKNNYIHIKIKNGIEIKLENISEEEKEKKLEEVKKYWHDVEYIAIG